MTLAAVILAGGRGTRCGDPLKCRPLLPRLVRELHAAGCSRIVIAGDHDGLDLPGCLRARDAAADGGPLAGIVGGLQACDGCPAALIVAGDQLRLRSVDLRRLIGAWRRRGRSAMAMQTAQHGPARAGILGVLDAADWPAATDNLIGRRRGVHRLWRQVAAIPVWFAPAQLADLDRPGDLLKFRARR